MKLNSNRLRTVVVSWVLLSLLMLIFLYGTSPDRIGPQGITLFFIVAYLFVALSLQVLVLVLKRVIARPKRLARWTITYSFILAFLPVVAISLQTLGQLVLRDVLIFTGMIVLIIFYLSKSPKN